MGQHARRSAKETDTPRIAMFASLKWEKIGRLAKTLEKGVSVRGEEPLEAPPHNLS